MLYACFGCVPEGGVSNFLFPVSRPEIHQLLLGLPSVKVRWRRIEIRVFFEGISNSFLFGWAEAEGVVCQVPIFAVLYAFISVVIVVFYDRLVQHL